MPRIRSIKPEFWTSEQVLECSTNARLLFIGLWNFCDDAGRHKFSPKTIKAEIFPSDDFSSENILGMLQELSRNRLIKTYAVENVGYLQVTGWRHQRIDKPQTPKFPDPTDDEPDLFQDHSTNDPRTFPPDTIGYDTIGEDAIGGRGATENPPLPKKKSNGSKKGHRLPDDWMPNENLIAWALENGATETFIKSETDKFKDYWPAQPGQRGVKLDWERTWKNWMRRALEEAPARRQGSSNGLQGYAAVAESLATKMAKMAKRET